MPTRSEYSVGANGPLPLTAGANVWKTMSLYGVSLSANRLVARSRATARAATVCELGGAVGPECLLPGIVVRQDVGDLVGEPWVDDLLPRRGVRKNGAPVGINDPQDRRDRQLGAIIGEHGVCTGQLHQAD